MKDFHSRNLRQRRKDWDAEKDERPDAVVPKEDIREVWLNYSKQPTSVTGTPPAPPSDATQPVAWRWHVKGQTGGWHYSDTRLVQTSPRNIVEPLYAHPEDAPEVKTCPICERQVSRHFEHRCSFRAVASEDAPEGPWEVKQSTLIPRTWDVVMNYRTMGYRLAFNGLKDEAIAVRDALNRLKGDEK